MIIFPLQGHTLVHALSSHTVNSPPTHLSGLYICVSTRCPNTATQLHSPNFTDRSLGPTVLRSTNWAIAGHQGTPCNIIITTISTTVLHFYNSIYNSKQLDRNNELRHHT